MEQEQTQEMNADEAKASLGIATRLSEQFFNPKQPKEASVSPESESGEVVEEKEQLDPEALKKDILKDVDKSIKDAIKEGMSSLKEELIALMSEEDDQDK